MNKQWDGFKEGIWQSSINVDDFINLNYTPYDGDSSFLAGPTARTTECNDKVKRLIEAERQNGGTLKVDASRIMNKDWTAASEEDLHSGDTVTVSELNGVTLTVKRKEK